MTKLNKNKDTIEFIENAECNEMPYTPQLADADVEVNKIPNANRAKTSRNSKH